MVSTAQACQQLYSPSAGMPAGATCFLDQGWPCFLPILTVAVALGRPWSQGSEGLAFIPAPVVLELWAPLAKSSAPAPRIARPSEGKGLLS